MASRTKTQRKVYEKCEVKNPFPKPDYLLWRLRRRANGGWKIFKILNFQLCASGWGEVAETMGMVLDTFHLSTFFSLDF